MDAFGGFPEDGERNQSIQKPRHYTGCQYRYIVAAEMNLTKFNFLIVYMIYINLSMPAVAS